MDIMERSLRKCMLGPKGTDSVARRVEPPLPEVGEVKMSSIDWWRLVIALGILPANRLPVLPGGNLTINVAAQRLILVRWRPAMLKQASRSSACLPMGSTCMEGNQRLIKQPQVLWVKQIVCERGNWSWLMLTAIMWREELEGPTSSQQPTAPLSNHQESQSPADKNAAPPPRNQPVSGGQRRRSQPRNQPDSGGQRRRCSASKSASLRRPSSPAPPPRTQTISGSQRHRCPSSNQSVSGGQAMPLTNLKINQCPAAKRQSPSDT